MKGLSYKISVLFLLLFFVQIAFGQMYQFKQYNIEEGLSHPFVYNIGEDKDGYIWVGTGEGLCQFDGFNFIVNEMDDSLTNGFVTSSYLDNKGVLWFGHNSGQITYYDGKSIKLLKTDDYINSSITSISGDVAGSVFIASQNNGLIKVNKDYKIDTFLNAFSGKLIYSIKVLDINNLLVGTGDGLKLYNISNNTVEEQYAIKELDYISVQSISRGKSDNTYWIGTEDSGFFLLVGKGDNFDSYELINIGEKYNIGYENVQSILEDNENVLWISTFGKGIFKLFPIEGKDHEYQNIINFNTKNGLPNNFIKNVYQDWEGNYWIATYGNGLAFSVDEAFTLHYQDIDELNGNILSIAESETSLWLGGEAVIVQINKESNKYEIFNTNKGGNKI